MPRWLLARTPNDNTGEKVVGHQLPGPSKPSLLKIPYGVASKISANHHCNHPTIKIDQLSITRLMEIQLCPEQAGRSLGQGVMGWATLQRSSYTSTNFQSSNDNRHSEINIGCKGNRISDLPTT